MKRSVLCTALLTVALCCLAFQAPSATPAIAASAPASSGQAPSGVWYEIFVRSWYDTNGDGIGDLNGITAKLDYLQSLGVSGIWLMPINPSPSYHGYDITDYEAINPQYGTLDDFQHLLREAHRRGIKVIMDMVINHTSDQHPWFKAARDQHSPYHDWYRWAGQYTDVDMSGATGGPAWHALGSQHYMGIFVAQMPDLNYDNPAVRAQMIAIGRFWLKLGVDGFRLDAARHLYDKLPSDVDDPASLQKNIAWWSEYRRGLDAVNPNNYLVGEVTMPSASQLAPYFKPLDAVFNFPLAVQLIDAAKAERNLDLAATLAHTYASYRAASGDTIIKDAPFLSNHDQERVMSQLDDNPQHMRVAAAMLLTLPGEPYIYYGEELGLQGHKPDPALREPMPWQRDPHAKGTTMWEPSVSGNGAAVSVAAEQAEPDSLLHYYTMLIHWRREIPALRDGSFRVYPEANDHLLAWQRADAQGAVLVVHNLSGAAQAMPLDVPGEPHYSKVLRQTGRGADIHDGSVWLPPYSSVILQ